MTMPLSVIIPVFNGAVTIADNVAELVTFLDSNFDSFEVIVVNDGSTDNTAEVLVRIQNPRLKIINLATNVGKFGAIKEGILVSTGDCCLFTDADLPYQLEAIPYAHRLITQGGFHLVTGDRRLRESKDEAARLLPRRLSSWIFSLIVRLCVTGEIYDTQCGLKALRGDVARILFGLLHDSSFSGDVELLYISLKYNLAIRRIPVFAYKGGKSTVKIFRDAIPMILRIMQLPLRWRAGVYESAPLRALSVQHYDIRIF